MKQDNSYTGADDYTTGMTFGFNWAKFRTTVSLETSEREPIINAKTGHHTLDFRHLSDLSTNIGTTAMRNLESYGMEWKLSLPRRVLLGLVH